MRRTRRPLAPLAAPSPVAGERRLSDEERAQERRFTMRVLAATLALQVAGGLLAAGLLFHRAHFGGAPPVIAPPTRGGASDVRTR